MPTAIVLPNFLVLLDVGRWTLYIPMGLKPNSIFALGIMSLTGIIGTGNILKGISNKMRKDIFHINILKMSFLLVIDNNFAAHEKRKRFFLIYPRFALSLLIENNNLIMPTSLGT